MERRLNVLLIEDNPGDARLIQESLLDLDLVWVKQLSAGLACLAEDDVDVILLDLSLPDSQGAETFARTYAQAPYVPIIVLTGHEDKEMALDLVRQGAQDYLIKGQANQGLLARAIHYAVERKQTEAQVYFQAQLLDNVRESVVATDLQGRVTYWGRGAKALYGYSAQEVMGKSITFIVEPQDEEAEQARMRQVKETGSWRGVYRQRRKDGSHFWADTSISLVRDRQGRPRGMVGIDRDITDRKQAQAQREAALEALRQAQDELEQRVEARTADLSRANVLLVQEVSERARVQEALRQSRRQLRELSARLAAVEEAEKQHLARELHDQVGQNLTALGINLNIVRAQLPPELASLQPRLDDALALVEETTERIRNVMAELRPPVLDDYGLVAALRWYAEQFTARMGLPVTVEGPGLAPRLAPAVEIALFRVVQEALTNVAKHAQASRATVALTSNQAGVRLVVADDGVGFDVSHRGQSWGLMGMTERAQGVGASFRIESSPQQGTRVIVEVAR